MDDIYYTVADVANILKLNQQTVRNWIDDGKIHAIRVGRRVRITKAEFDRFLADAEKRSASTASGSGITTSKPPADHVVEWTAFRGRVEELQRCIDRAEPISADVLRAFAAAANALAAALEEHRLRS